MNEVFALCVAIKEHLNCLRFFFKNWWLRVKLRKPFYVKVMSHVKFFYLYQKEEEKGLFLAHVSHVSVALLTAEMCIL